MLSTARHRRRAWYRGSVPFQVSLQAETRPGVTSARTSAAMELFCVLIQAHALPSSGGPLGDLLQRDPELHESIRTFWDDGASTHCDLLILALRADELYAEEIDGLREKLDGVAEQELGDIGLTSEDPNERAAVVERLNRLQVEPDLRHAYRRLLEKTWAAMSPQWTESGRTAVKRSRAQWEERLAAGDDVYAHIPAGHMGRWEAFRPLIDAALAQGKLVVVPLFFAGGGGFVVDLPPGMVVIGVPLEDRPVDRVRATAEPLANGLKVISDPTRLAVLSFLAKEPLSVGDLTKMFGLSQPTISAHVRQLREAGWLDTRREGNRVLYFAPRDRYERLLGAATQAFRNLCSQ